MCSISQEQPICVMFAILNTCLDPFNLNEKFRDAQLSVHPCGQIVLGIELWVPNHRSIFQIISRCFLDNNNLKASYWYGVLYIDLRCEGF